MYRSSSIDDSPYLAGKFRQPTGVVGRLVGYMMARGNAYEAAWTVTLLNIHASDHILEIGFGPGLAIEHAARRATNGLVAGVDYAAPMVRAARAQRRCGSAWPGRSATGRGCPSAVPE